MEDKRIQLSDKQKKARIARNIAIGCLLGSLVIIFYLVTLFKLGFQILDRPL